MKCHLRPLNLRRQYFVLRSRTYLYIISPEAYLISLSCRRLISILFRLSTNSLNSTFRNRIQLSQEAIIILPSYLNYSTLPKHNLFGIKTFDLSEMDDI